MKRIVSVAALVVIVAALAPAYAARNFTPSKRLAGKRVKVQGMSVVIPTGWAGKFAKQHGTDALVVQSRRAAQQGALFATRHQLSAQERRAPVANLLAAEVRKLVGNAPIKVTLAPEALEVSGKRAARLIIGATTNGRQLELYAAAVVVDGWAFVFMGVYAADKSKLFRPALETMLTSLRGKPPQQNVRLRRRLARCWEHYYFSKGGGGGSSTTRLSLNPNGSYSYTFHMSVAGASKRSNEAGTWSVYGNQIVTTPNNGAATSRYNVSWKGYILYLNGTKYLPCS